MIRCKVVCQRKDSNTVFFGPGNDGIVENAGIVKADLVGPIAFTTSNEDALAQFKQGQEYFIDFTSTGGA